MNIRRLFVLAAIVTADHTGFIGRPIPTVEVGIFVDLQFQHKYQKLGHNVDKYIEKLVDIMQDVYHSPSLGRFIQLKITHVVKLRQGFSMIDASQLLSSFCAYQEQYLYHQDTGKQPDHSVLITGGNLCIGDNRETAACQTVGLANIGSMCKQHSSCTVAQDTGLGTAYTIAHEMGHAFGLLHDGDGNHCRSYPGSFMAPMLRSSGSGQFQWSSCSRSRMEAYLESDQAWCLYQTQDESETPQNGHFVKTRSLTQMVTKRGKTELVNYSADEQCEMQFGRGTKVCPYKISGMCQQLHCQTGAHLCQSLLLPEQAAQGTPCLEGSFSGRCHQGSCILGESNSPLPSPRNYYNTWSEWSTITECPAQCGPAVQFRKRSCPTSQCPGDSTSYIQCPKKSCTDPSPITSLQLAIRQCSTDFFSKTYAPDGMSCSLTGQHYCLEGNCIMVSCESNSKAAKVDNCGVCNGNNSSCKKQREIIWPRSGNNRTVVYTLPVGSTHIKIVQKRKTLMPSFRVGDFRASPDYRNHKFSSKAIDGTVWHYKFTNSRRDLFYAVGPLKNSVDLALLGRLHPGAIVSFYKPNQPDTFKIVHQKSLCSKSCGGGVMDIQQVCFSERMNTQVDSKYCRIRNSIVEKRRCNMENCPARWEISEWSKCDQQCGTGKMSRIVKCRQHKMIGDFEVPDNMCATEKPSTEKPCRLKRCSPQWRYSRSWTPCSKNCGRGIRTRQQGCYLRLNSGRYKRQPLEKCSMAQRLPEKTHQCHGDHCPHRPKRKSQWEIGPWSECSTTCNQGYRTRPVTCRKRCLSSKPTTWESCNLGSCEEAKSLQKRLLPPNKSCTDTKDSCKTTVVKYDMCRYANIRSLCCETCNR